MAVLAPPAKQQFFDSNGDPLSGGLLYSYAVGTTTPKATYQDRLKAIANTNPIVLDSRGECILYLDGATKLVLQTAAGAVIWTRDPVEAVPGDGDLTWTTVFTEYRLVATAGQTVFTIPGTYAMGTSSLAIYLDGLRLVPLYDWAETTTSTFTLTAACSAGQEVVALVGMSVNANNSAELVSFTQTGTGALARSVASCFRERISVKDFGASGNGSSDDVAAFQAAVTATTNSGVQIIHVPFGTYVGDFSTIAYGSRHVIWDEEGSVSYPGTAPTNSTRMLHGTGTAVSVKSYSTPTRTPTALRGEVIVSDAAGVSGLPWAVLGKAESRVSDAGTNVVGVYGQAISYDSNTSSIWGMVAESGDSRPDNATYGTTYPTKPSATQGSNNGIEVDSVRTGAFNDTTTRSIGIQIVSFGGTESTNAIEVHASTNTRSHSHDGTAQAGGASTITLASDAIASNDYYKDSLVTIVSGTGAGQERKITGYVGATLVATVDSAWATTPDATSVYVVYDQYRTGMWRRGLSIYDQALNQNEGIGVTVDSDCNTGYRVTGNTTTADFSVVRSGSNLAKFELETGVATNGLAVFRQSMYGLDDAATPNKVEYARISTVIDSNTSTSEYGTIRFQPIVNGATSTSTYVEVGDGVKVGNPTGGFKGVGTINAKAVYDDDVGLTCYVFEAWQDGVIDLAKWNAIASTGTEEPREHKPAKGFASVASDRIDTEKFCEWIKQNKRMPAFPGPEKWQADGPLSVGDTVQRLWETVEVLAVHIAKLHDRVKELEKAK